MAGVETAKQQLSLESALRSLVDPPRRGNGRLKPAAGRGALAGQVGIGRPAAAAATSSGIASPLTEVENTGVNERIYYSLDPAIFLEVHRATKFTDANGATVEIILA